MITKRGAIPLVLVVAGLGLLPATTQGSVPAPATSAESASQQAALDENWRRPELEDTIYFELPNGRVVLELAPDFAPRHSAQIRRLVRAGFFDGGRVVRSQDNYVAQWGIRPPREGEQFPEWVTGGLAAEFDRAAGDLPWAPLPDADTYAPEVGFTRGFPSARTSSSGRAWVVHCYGVVGVARDTEPGTGNASQLYAVTGQAPRHLDRNLTMVGRVIHGMERLTTLPRGTEALGFYATDEEMVPIRAARVAADVPEAERTTVEVMRTDTEAFREFVAARRQRTETFFVQSPSAIDVCNLRLPSRLATP